MAKTHRLLLLAVQLTLRSATILCLCKKEKEGQMQCYTIYKVKLNV